MIEGRGGELLRFAGAPTLAAMGEIVMLAMVDWTVTETLLVIDKPLASVAVTKSVYEPGAKKVTVSLLEAFVALRANGRRGSARGLRAD